MEEQSSTFLIATACCFLAFRAENQLRAQMAQHFISSWNRPRMISPICILMYIKMAGRFLTPPHQVLLIYDAVIQ